MRRRLLKGCKNMKLCANKRAVALMAFVAMAAWAFLFNNVCHSAEKKGGGLSQTSPVAGGFRLTVEKDRLSLTAKGASIHEILTEMARLTGAQIDVGQNGDVAITASFQGLPLDQAVGKIAPNRGVVYSQEPGRNRWKAVRIVVPPTDSTASTSSGVSSGRPQDRPQYSDGPSTTFSLKRSPVRPIPRAQERSSTEIQGAPSSSPKYVPGELLVRFKKSASIDETSRLVAGKGMAVKRQNKAADYTVVSLPESLPVEEAATWLVSHDLVDFAEPNYLLSVQDFLNDPRYFQQWALTNMDAEPAWDLETGRPEVVIAVIDTGVDWDHPDLAANIWYNPGEIPGNETDDDGNGFIDDHRGWDFVEDAEECVPPDDCSDRDNDPMDVQGHGTHVAGIAGAVTNNDEGIAGVTWGCKIMAVRAGYKDTDGNGKLEIDDAVDAIHYAVDNGAHVLNLSWGGRPKIIPANPDDAFPLIKEAIVYAAQKGVIICAAAGNDGSKNEFWPAAYSDPLVLAVGSTDNDNQKASTSNYGDWVDVSAPGVDILSTCVGGSYCNKSGTSMATPHVAGLAGLLFSRFPGWSSMVIKDMILDSVYVVSGLSGQNITSGIINLNYALEVDDLDFSRFTEHIAGSFGVTACGSENPCDGDLDGDGDVDGSDLALLLQY